METPTQISQAPTYPTYTVAMTAYNAVSEQTDGDPNVTASGVYSNPEIVAARSADLADTLPFGTVISVTPSAASTRACGLDAVQDLVGLRVIADTMSARKRDQIDILFDTKADVRVDGKETNAAVALGMCKGVHIRVVGKVDIKNLPKTQNELRLAVGALEQPADAPLALNK